MADEKKEKKPAAAPTTGPLPAPSLEEARAAFDQADRAWLGLLATPRGERDEDWKKKRDEAWRARHRASTRLNRAVTNT